MGADPWGCWKQPHGAAAAGSGAQPNTPLTARVMLTQNHAPANRLPFPPNAGQPHRRTGRPAQVARLSFVC